MKKESESDFRFFLFFHEKFKKFKKFKKKFKNIPKNSKIIQK